MSESSEQMEPPKELLTAIGCKTDDEPIDVFPRSQKGKASFLLGTIGFAGLGVAFLVFAVLVAPQFDEGSQRTVVYGFGVLVMLLAGGFAWSWATGFRKTADLVYLYEQGLVWHSAANDWKSGRWADAVAIHRKESYEAGTEGGFIRVEFTTSEQAHCSRHLENYPALAEQAQRFVHRELFPIVKQRFNAGEVIEFGSLKISKKELVVERTEHTSAGRYPLADLQEAAIAHGCLLLNHKTRGLTGTAIPLAEIPNYTVLIALLPIVPEGWTPAAFE
jgi:hypothetical protein